MVKAKTIIDLNNIPELTENLTFEDDIVILHEINKYPIAFKGKLNILKKLFSTKIDIENFKRVIETLNIKIQNITKTYEDFQDAKGRFELLENINIFKNKSLEKTEFLAIVANFVMEDDVSKISGELIELKEQLVEEMTDYAMAACVGMGG